MREGHRSPVTIREMREEDIDDVLAIEIAGSPTPWTHNQFSEEIHNPLSIARVAEQDGVIVGYVCASTVLDEGHILTVAVHPRRRRSGIANALVGGMISYLRAKGCSRIFLEVRVSNVPAIGMYHGLGFRDLSRRKDYYRFPVEDALIMVIE